MEVWTRIAKCELLDVKTRDKHRKVYKFQIANGLEALAKESGLLLGAPASASVLPMNIQD